MPAEPAINIVPNPEIRIEPNLPINIVPNENVPENQIVIAEAPQNIYYDAHQQNIFFGANAYATSNYNASLGCPSCPSAPEPDSWMIETLKKKYDHFIDNRVLSSSYYTVNGMSVQRYFPEIDTAKTFLDFVQIMFGFDSKAIVRMVGEKFLYEKVLQNYANPLPGTYVVPNDNGWGQFTYGNVCWTISGSSMTIPVDPPYLEPKRQMEFDLSLLVKGQLGRGLLCLDRMQTLIKNHVLSLTGAFNLSYDATRIRNFLQLYDEPRRLRILSTVNNDLYSLSDTVTLYEAIKDVIDLPLHFKDLVDLHDQMSRLHRVEMAKKNNKPILYKKSLCLLDHLKIPVVRDGKEFELQLIVPPDSMTMNLWGHALNNCLGMYGDRYAQQGTANEFVFGFEKDGEIMYAARYAHVPLPPTKDDPHPGSGFRCIEFRMKNNANDQYVEQQVNLRIMEAWQHLAMAAETV